MGKKKISIFGPKNLTYYIQSQRYIIYRDFCLDLKEVEDFEEVFKDDFVTINGVTIELKEKEEKEIEIKEVKTNHYFEIKDVSKEIKNEKYKSKKHESVMKLSTQNKSITIYFCKTRDLPGRFDPNKAKSLGVNFFSFINLGETRTNL
jgi:hypothetical protein